MTPAQLDDAIQGVTDSLILYARMVSGQFNLHQQSPAFSPTPDLTDQRRIAHVASPPQDQANAQALQKQLKDEIDRIQEQDKAR